MGEGIYDNEVRSTVVVDVDSRDGQGLQAGGEGDPADTLKPEMYLDTECVAIANQDCAVRVVVLVEIRGDNRGGKQAIGEIAG